MRSRPTSRSTRWPVPTQTCSDHRRPADQGDIETTHRAVRALLLRPGAGRLLLAPRPDPFDPRASAGSEPGPQELELGRRPRAGLPDQPVAGDRRRQRYMDMLVSRADTIEERTPGLREQPVRPGAVLRGLEPDDRPGAGSRTGRRRAQPQDRLEPDAHPPRRPHGDYVGAGRKINTTMPRSAATSSAAAGTTWWSASGEARRPPLRLARPQGLVAAGAGDPRLPDPGRLDRRRRGAPPRARGGRVLQRVLPRPRRGRRLLQRPGQRHPVPARHRAAEGQPLDGGLPLVRAGLPGDGLHEPADHQGADGQVHLLSPMARSGTRSGSAWCRPSTRSRSARRWTATSPR